MMVKTLQPEDYPLIQPLLEQFPTNENVDWALLFHNGWNRIDGTVGFGLIDGGRSVGYLGTLQTQRTVDGRTFRGVNLTTWFVLKDYRAHSMDLQRAVIQYDNCVVTGLTPIPQILKRYDSLGYRAFDTGIRLLFFNPAALFTSADGVSVAIGRDVPDLCDDVERTLIADHEPHGCVPFLFRTKDGSRCLIIAQRVYRRYKGRRLATAHVLYISNREFFSATNAYTRNAIMRTLRCALLACDERFLDGTVPTLSLRIPLPTPRIIWDNIGIDASKIDNLYTELVLLRC